MAVSFNIAETFDAQTMRMHGKPIKKGMGRPNEDRKVNELLKKLEVLKAAKKKPA
jgi:hypothetical protein